MKTKIEQRHRKKAVQVASCLNWDDWASYAKTNYLEGIERLAEIFADFEQERLAEARELLKEARSTINIHVLGNKDHSYPVATRLMTQIDAFLAVASREKESFKDRELHDAP